MVAVAWNYQLIISLSLSYLLVLIMKASMQFYFNLKLHFGSSSFLSFIKLSATSISTIKVIIKLQAMYQLKDLASQVLIHTIVVTTILHAFFRDFACKTLMVIIIVTYLDLKVCHSKTKLRGIIAG